MFVSRDDLQFQLGCIKVGLCCAVEPVFNSR